MIDSQASLVEVRSKAAVAILRASVDIIRRAKQTGTPVLIWENGHVRRLAPDEIARRAGVTIDS